MTTAVTTNPYDKFNTSSTTTKSGASAIQDQFLKLLMAQLQSQDPLNPMDNSQVTSQMAQLSTVEGIEKLNTTMTSLSSAYAASQSFAAAGMIGHVALTPGSGLPLTVKTAEDGTKTGSSAGAVELPNGADSVVVSVYDSKGNLVDKVNMGAQEAGTAHFVWDGKTSDGTQLDSGNYTFSVSATKGGAATTATALAYSRVDALTWKDGNVLLALSTGENVDISKVRELM
ncbi:MAG: flagellar hook assembly protein FlgD [Microvirgula sp.]